MHINIGDLVMLRKNLRDDSENGLAIVVKKSSPVQGLDKSLHVRHIMESYAPVFYVCDASGQCLGPLQGSELLLQQSYSR